MKKTLFTIFAVIFLTGTFIALRDRLPSSNAPDGLEIYNSLQGMNDILFRDYMGFESKWHLVTVRFRVDTEEQRFTYANDLAYAALQKGGTDYPDGAVFGKIGVMTDDDPSFASSRVPSGSVRYQLMVRDKKKYAATGGWGYAIYTGKHQDMPEGELTQSCLACHELVKKRSYVFSQPMNLEPHQDQSRPINLNNPLLTFSDHDAKELPELLKQSLPAGTKKVRFLEGEMRQHLFVGTLDEIRPSLTNESIRAGEPSVLVGEDGVSFIVVSQLAESCAATVGFVCGAGEKPYEAICRTSSDPHSKVYRMTFCTKTN